MFYFLLISAICSLSVKNVTLKKIVHKEVVALSLFQKWLLPPSPQLRDFFEPFLIELFRKIISVHNNRTF